MRLSRRSAAVAVPTSNEILWAPFLSFSLSLMNSGKSCKVDQETKSATGPNKRWAKIIKSWRQETQKKYKSDLGANNELLRSDALTTTELISFRRRFVTSDAVRSSYLSYL